MVDSSRACYESDGQNVTVADAQDFRSMAKTPEKSAIRGNNLIQNTSMERERSDSQHNIMVATRGGGADSSLENHQRQLMLQLRRYDEQVRNEMTHSGNGGGRGASCPGLT